MEKLHIDPEELGDKMRSKDDLYKIYKYQCKGILKKDFINV